MSEQFKQDAGSNSPEVEDDPLAELARIVAGEPELNSQPQAQPVEEITSPNTTLPNDSMEAALEEQLMQEFSLEQDAGTEVAAPDFVDDINASIEELTSLEEPFTPDTINEEPVTDQSMTAPQFQEAAQVHVAEPNVNSDADFQDGLIDALELEIGGAPEPVQEIPVQSEITPEPAIQVETAEIEFNEVSMQEALEQELGSQFEPTANVSVVDEITSQESVALEPELTENTVAASIEDDLGSAFANELEQISAQQTVETHEPVMEQAIEPVAENPIVTEPIVTEAVINEQSQTPVQGDPGLEMDFEAAFAQELEVASVPASDGWVETDTAEANAAFAAALGNEVNVTPSENLEVNLDSLDLDPGHVGSVDDLETVDQPVVANDNGGGKKYAVAALVIALFAGAIAAGYGFLGGDNATVASGTPDIIKADVDPVKVKPKDPGGLVPENQDNASYGDLGGENNVAVSQQTLNSQTEEPLILNTGNTAEAPKSDDRLTASEDTGATPNSTGSSVLPKVVQTVVVKPDGTIITKPAVPKPVETALNTVTIGDTSNVEVKPVTTQVITKPNAIDGAKTTGDVSVPVASPLPKPVVKAKPKPVKKVAAAPKPKKVAPPPTRKSEWVVQVASQRTPEAAQSSFSTMRNKFSALQGRAMSIQRANVNGTTYYRVRVQTASKSDANQLCSRLASAGGNCFVTR